ncbi:hypothetical protein Hs30E_18780 [Lactococcus hodotermopsidis]|uniref:Uncharacterized protein n=1 Tax=Pseudolactococcus hodotermopsidis TaxID=2709157 RepID=A0A6A0BHQ3_9LACT|nr:hypothetical protein Hs30E_18780 [Lactococcus hodotermopsidis]
MWGKLERCSRRDAMDALFFECGGIPQEDLNSFVSHVVVGKGNEHVEKYREAKQGEKNGYLIPLNRAGIL